MARQTKAEKEQKAKANADVEAKQNDTLEKTTEVDSQQEETGKKADAKQETIPAHIDKILEANPQYAQLYINDRGGIFTPSSPEYVRGNAKLYNNKYHK